MSFVSCAINEQVPLTTTKGMYIKISDSEGINAIPAILGIWWLVQSIRSGDNPSSEELVQGPGTN